MLTYTRSILIFPTKSFHLLGYLPFEFTIYSLQFTVYGFLAIDMNDYYSLCNLEVTTFCEHFSDIEPNF